MLALRGSREGRGIIYGRARGDRERNDRRIEIARWCEATAIGRDICGGGSGQKHTTLPPKVSESPCRPRGCECPANSVRMYDRGRSHPGGLERRRDHGHLNVRQVLGQLAPSTRTPRSRWQATVPVPHIEMKGNGTAHTPARTGRRARRPNREEATGT